MRKGLRKIAQRLALSPGLFRVKPEMIGIAQHPFKQQPGLIQLFGKYLAGAGQRLYQPERTHVEGAFLARKSVDAGLRRITIYKAVADESAIPRILENGAYGAEHPRIGRSHEEDQRHDQKRCVQVLTAVKLREGAAFLVQIGRA